MERVELSLTFPVHLAVRPGALVDAAVRVLVSAVAVHLPVHPVALVLLHYGALQNANVTYFKSNRVVVI